MNACQLYVEDERGIYSDNSWESTLSVRFLGWNRESPLFAEASAEYTFVPS
jgi:hypothetical protein